MGSSAGGAAVCSCGSLALAPEVTASSPFGFARSDFFATGFVAVPFVFALAGAAAFDRGGLFTSVFSCTLLALAAVGFIILSRKPPSAGAWLLRVVDVCDVRELGRWSGASEDRLGLTVEVVGFGLEAVDARRLLVVDVGLLSASCFARDEAVGAVR